MHIVSFYMFINDNIVILATFVMYLIIIIWNVWICFHNMKCVNLFRPITFPIWLRLWFMFSWMEYFAKCVWHLCLGHHNLVCRGYLNALWLCLLGGNGMGMEWIEKLWTKSKEWGVKEKCEQIWGEEIFYDKVCWENNEEGEWNIPCKIGALKF